MVVWFMGHQRTEERPSITRVQRLFGRCTKIINDVWGDERWARACDSQNRHSEKRILLVILQETGKLKVLLQPDGQYTLPVHNDIAGNELSIESRDIFAAIVACGSLPNDLIPKILYNKVDEIRLKRIAVDLALKAEKGFVAWDIKKIKLLDPSEEAFISYVVGMVFMTLIVRKLYDIEILSHFKKFVRETDCKAYMQNGTIVKKHKEPDIVGLKYNGTDIDFSLYEAKGGEKKSKRAYNKAINEQLPVVNTLLGKNVDNRLLCYSVCDKSLNNAKKQNRKRNLLKVIISYGNQPDQDSLDFKSTNKVSAGFIRNEFDQLIEDIEECKQSKDFAQRFGRIEEKTDNGRQLVEIHYTDRHYITISIGDGDDVRIYENYLLKEVVTARENCMIKKLNNEKPV